jgi:hypothetical protein
MIWSYPITPHWTDDPKRHEFCRRMNQLVDVRRMSKRAAMMVVDAAMFGIGCVEGEVRDRIQKELEASDESKRESNTGTLQSKP